MKILIGTYEIGRQMHDLAAGFRALGHEADTLAVARNPQHPDLTYTYELPEQYVAATLKALHQYPLDTLLRRGPALDLIRHLLTEYDLYVFQFASSLLPNNADYPLLKQQGKKLACVFMGSDVRHWSGAEPVSASYGIPAPSMLREAPYNHLNTRLNNLRMAERHADAIFSLPFQSELAIRPYWHVQLPLDLAQYSCSVPDREVPVIVHAPTRRSFKGTPAVLAALDRLREEGERFELRLLENVPNREVLRALTEADMVIDQLHAPHYGMLGLEGMASGCVVVGGNNPGYVPAMRDSPVVHATEREVYEVVRHLLHDRPLRRTLAEHSRAYAETTHAHTSVAATLLEKLELHSAFEYYPTFYTTQYAIPDGEELHPNLPRLASEIISRHGMPAEADVDALVEKGLAEASLRETDVVRWELLTSNISREIWGWSPLHVTDADGEINRSAMVVEAASSVRMHVESHDLTTAADVFAGCIAEVNANQAHLSDDNVVLALALAAESLAMREEATAFLKRGLEIHPKSRALARCLMRLTPGSSTVSAAA